MSRHTWPGPLEKVRWTQAFKRKDKIVVDDRGRKFSCRYDLMDGFVLVKPVSFSFVPMGYLPLDLTTEIEYQERIDPVYATSIKEFLTLDVAGLNVKEYWPNRFGRTTGATLDRKFRQVGSPDVNILLIKGQVYLTRVKGDEQQ